MNKLLFGFVLFFLLACQKEEKVMLRRINLAPFDEILLEDPFQVFLTTDSVISVQVEGYEKQLQNIHFSTENGILIIKDLNKQKWLFPKKNKIRLLISHPNLKKVTATDGNTIETVNPIKTAEFGLVLKGKAAEANLEFDNETVYYYNNFPCGGKVTFSGKTDVLKIWNFGLMGVDASGLTANTGLIENTSKSDVHLNLAAYCEYTIRGPGNLYLSGNPPTIVEKEVTSSGRLILK